ncbi:hypothetical protein V6N13_110972 [Hibiscus sabdariffa]|uniref:TF-B3 domain-containing protein n=1 Tax=Hibiscus sabdariffa TaxID=183260 RepID=A0ABR2TJ52_9ROSI
MDSLRDWPPFQLLAEAVEVAASREKGIEDAEDKLLKTENPEKSKPFAFSGSDGEQPKTLTADESMMEKEVKVVRLFGVNLICTEESHSQVTCTNWPEPEASSKKPEERVDDRKRRFESGECSCSRAKKPRLKDTCGHAHEPVPDLPETFTEKIKGMEGSEVKFIIQKRLYSTDLSKHHGRLSVPLNKVKAEFLSSEEKKVLEGGSKQGIEALIIGPCLSLRGREVSLKRWEMKKQTGRPSSVVYAITKGWNSVVQDNQLKQGHLIQIWSFRANSKLCFALLLVHPSLGEEGR